MTEICYIRRVLKTQVAAVFKLSNRLVQAVFCDLKELVLDHKSQLITLMAKGGYKVVQDVKIVSDPKPNEFSKYLRYMQSLFKNMAV